MIYDIVDSLKDILEDAANLKANNEGLESLEEERAAREASLERRAREQETRSPSSTGRRAGKVTARPRRRSREGARKEAPRTSSIESGTYHGPACVSGIERFRSINHHIRSTNDNKRREEQGQLCLLLGLG